MQFWSLFCLFLISGLFAQDYDPKIFLPNSDTTWRMGYKQLIAWNSSYTRPDGLYYNNLTRINVNLYQAANSTKSGRQELIATIIQNFPLSLGNLVWSIPQNLSNQYDKFNASQESKLYFIKVYPSFFDWPKSCKNCLNDQPPSQPFKILASDCDGQCSNIPDPYLPYGSVQQDYTTAVRAVGIAVGVVAFIVLSISLYVYGKRGFKVIDKYRRRRSGLIYKYNPPQVDKFKDNDNNDPFNPSPLRKFFSVESFNQNASEQNVNKSPKRQTSLAHLGDRIIKDAEQQSQSINNDGRISPMEKIVLDLPPSPPKLYSRPSHATLKGSTSYQSMSQTLHQPMTRNQSQLFESCSSDFESTYSSPVLNKRDAILVADTFRQALRVNGLDESEAFSEDSLESDIEQKENVESFSNVGTSDSDSDVPPAPVGSYPMFSVGSSPVLGKLAALDKEQNKSNLKD